MHRGDIATWMAKPEKRLTITYDVGFDVGRVIANGASTSQSTSKVFVLLEKDPLMPRGFRVHTAFPE